MGAGMKRYWFEITPEQDKSINIIAAMFHNEFGINIQPFKQRRSSRFAEPVGAGFGDRVWRVNYLADQIEASFSHPCWQSKAVKQGGMKWNHQGGLWYGANTQQIADMCNMLKLTQVDAIGAGGVFVPQ